MAALAFLLGAGAVAALLSVGATLVGSTVVALAMRVRSSARRADLALLGGVMPAVAAVVGTLAATLPSWFAALGADDHCLEHLHHAHLCPVHSSELHTRILVIGSIALAAVATGAIAWASRALRARRFVNAALRVGTHNKLLGVDVVSLPGAPRLLHTVGVLSPRVVVSDALLALLSPSARAAVLAHEAGHVKRRDGLALGLLSLAALCAPPAFGAWARRVFIAAADEAADDYAAARVGSLDVADAIVAVARLRARSPIDGVALAADGAEVEARVTRLLSSAPRAQRSWLPLVVAAVASFAWLMFVAADGVHHAAETLLFLFT